MSILETKYSDSLSDYSGALWFFRKVPYFIKKNTIALFDSKTGLQSKTEKCGRTRRTIIFNRHLLIYT